jgi:hypothetical protein
MLLGVTQIVYRTALAPNHSDLWAHSAACPLAIPLRPNHSDLWAHSTACPLAIPLRPNRREHETRNCVSSSNYWHMTAPTHLLSSLKQSVRLSLNCLPCFETGSVISDCGWEFLEIKLSKMNTEDGVTWWVHPGLLYFQNTLIRSKKKELRPSSLNLLGTHHRSIFCTGMHRNAGMNAENTVRFSLTTFRTAWLSPIRFSRKYP